MEKLAEIIKLNWSEIVEEFNTHIQNNFENFFFMKFSEFFENSQTQDITKILSPIFNSIFYKKLKKFGLNKYEVNGCDYLYNQQPLESKITLSLGDSWVGNGYEKTNWHLLIKLKLNSDGLIESSFCALVPLDDCVSKWSKPNLKSNYSGLKFEIEDLEKFILIEGKIRKKAKYLLPILI